MEKTVEMQRKIKENSNELNDFLQDLTRWEGKIKKEDENLKTSRRIDENLPPIRKGKKPVMKLKKEAADSNRPNIPIINKEKIKSYDYDAWSKFDVEAACDDIDKTDDYFDEDDEEDEEEIERIEEERKLQQAAMEKDKGNQLFKEGKYDAAINRYTIAIGLHTTNAIFYANRAMALLKMDRYGAAEQDCSIALQLDPTYTKALARRATARHKLRNYKEAFEDFKNVLKYEPKNKQALTEIEMIQKTLKNLEQQKKKEEVKKDVVNDCETSSKRKKRSNKPLKRVFIQEIGISDDESETQTTNTIEKFKQEADRVPPLHQSKDKASSSESVINLHTMNTPSIIPTSSFMFETEFKRIKNDQESLYKYLKMIPCESYTKLFHQCIDSLICSFLQTLVTCYIRDQLEIHKELEHFASVDRFGMAVMFLSQNDKKALDELFSYLKSTEYPGAINCDKLKELCKMFGVKQG